MSQHREVAELLPWYVNGTLTAREESMVAGHLQTCAECGGEVRNLLEMAALLRSEVRPTTAETTGARTRFMAALPADGRRGSRRWIVPLSLAASLIVAALFLAPLLQRQEGFRTLGESGLAEGAVVQLLFTAEATESTMRGIILGTGGHIVSGPTQQGVYRVELPDEASATAVLARLRQNPSVQFAELESRP